MSLFAIQDRTRAITERDESVLHPIDFFKMADNDDKKGSYAEYFCLDKHGGAPP